MAPALITESLEPQAESEQSPNENALIQAASLIERVNVLARLQIQKRQAYDSQTKRGEEDRALSKRWGDCPGDVDSAADCGDSSADNLPMYRRKMSLRQLWKETFSSGKNR